MATKEAIRTAFQTFVALGLREMPATPEELRARIEVWAALLPDISDADLEAAVVAYLRDPTDSEFFPRTPGKLLKFAPNRATPDEADELFPAVMRYMDDHPKRWHDPSNPHISYDHPYRGTVPVPRPPPPWTEAQAEAVSRATDAIGGVKGWALHERGSYAATQAEATWKRVYRAARRGEAQAIEARTVQQVTGGQRRIGVVP